MVAQLVGNWSFFGLFFVMAVFNILGEEFFFRGVLLPKMGGVFGKGDWVVNGVLMGAYHWHQPWMILTGALLMSPLSFLPTGQALPQHLDVYHCPCYAIPDNHPHDTHARA